VPGILAFLYDKCLDKCIIFLYNTYITNIKTYVDWAFLRIYLYAHTIKLLGINYDEKDWRWDMLSRR